MTRMRTLFYGASLLPVLLSSSLLYGATGHVRGVTAITEVFGDGQKVSAVAIEYDTAINSSKLSASLFSVEGKTITRIYANTAPEKAARGGNGRYIIIELATAQTAASGPGEGRRGRGPADAGPGGRGPGDAGPGGRGPDGARGGPGGRGGRGFGMVTVPVLRASVTQTGTLTTVDGEQYPPNSSSMTNDKTVNLVADDFQQLEFKDAKTGGTLMYNLFVPKQYDRSKSYPMVLFIHDAGVLSNDVKMALAQGVGAAIWATPSEQAKHASFVLAPQYSKVMSGDDYETLVDLIDSLSSQYNIARNRVYATGQSMGCMNELGISIKYPNLFAAMMLVAGQWDAQATSVLANKKIWILVAEGDTGAFPGMNASVAVWEAAGTKISKARWNARATTAETAANVRKMAGEETNIKYVVFDKGTVWPEGVSGGMEHMQTWKVAYYIEGVRDWLFDQK